MDEESIKLFYDEEENVIIDEGGYIIFDIFRIITPQIMNVFRKKKQYTQTYAPDGRLVELFYPIYEEDDVRYYDF
jgi:hypothetical protein